MLVGFEDKSAYAQTIVAFCPRPGADVQFFTGQTGGKIVRPRGSLDFGWVSFRKVIIVTVFCFADFRILPRFRYYFIFSPVVVVKRIQFLNLTKVKERHMPR